ncbi:MAG: type III polyketide synthase [Gemmatimonadota bacterium]
MHLSGIGTALPLHDAPQSEAAELHAELSGLDPAKARTLRALYRRSGVQRRASVLLDRPDGPLRARQDFYRPVADEGDLGPTTAQRMARYERAAPTLAVEAARRALEDADVPAARVSHLVTVSCTGFVSPGVDTGIVRKLGLARGVTRTQVGFMGCHGTFNGLRVAQGFTRADPKAVALVCSVELCSLHFAYGWDPESIVANALFADGAGALLCCGEQAAGSEGPDGSPSWRIRATGSVLLDDSADDMTWRIGDHGFRMTLSPRVPDVIGRDLRSWLTEWLSSFGLGLGDIESWAVHPGGPRILDAVEGALDLERSRTSAAREVLAAHGNMSSATILFILQRLRRSEAPRPCVALAFGPGLVAEAALIL